MNYLLLLTIVSSICSIISLFVSKYIRSKIWIWIVVVFILTFASGYAVHYYSELERIKNIHRQAKEIYEHYDPYCIQNNAFVHESLIFLEENRDRYPDAYKRAQQICTDIDKSEFQYDPEPARKICGIIKGIAILNKE